MLDLKQLGQKAGAAARSLATVPREQKDTALYAIADALLSEQEDILTANRADVAEAQENGLSEALIDRLTLTPERLANIAADTRKVAELPDPVGEEFDARTLENGLRVCKRRTPLGVLGVIYESRPNVTIDIAALALKSGNAVILRGGKETLRSNKALIKAVQRGLEEADLPGDSVQYIDDPDRRYVLELLRLHEYVDMIIPRGGAGLHQFCRENATVPVITGGVGVCHLFVDASADLDRALDVLQNAKVQRPSVCNALDTALIHRAIAADFLPRLADRLAQDGVRFKADEEALAILEAASNGRWQVEPAGPGDWDTEWLSLVLGIKVVGGLEEAIEHIQAHSTGHSDGILTQDQMHADRFVDRVDSAAVYVNASTRFTDGAQFGLGAEVAISTQKLHARGPMALRELTTYKWIIIGDGHVRA
ncbi:MAG TPA: glutamate-5-semialdehyde dehydrogenase [Chloroflexi bacterium]|nr:glutamate-5-semialdehyde dehydrogenase [Chloroflexota bacterium]